MGQGGAKCRGDKRCRSIYFAGSHLAVARRHPVGNLILGNHMGTHGGGCKWAS